MARSKYREDGSTKMMRVRKWTSQFILLLCFMSMLQRDLLCEAFVSPSKFIGTDLSNDSYIDYLSNVRTSERTLWSPVKANRSGRDEELSSYWSKLRTNEYSRLIDFNVTTAKSLSLFLHEFADVQIGVTEMKNIFDSISFDAKRVPSLEEQARVLADKFSAQLQRYHEALEGMVAAVKSDQFRVGPPQIPKCCELKPEKFQVNELYNMPIWKESACWTVASKMKASTFVPGLNFSQALVRNSEILPHLKWQYFVSPEGVYVEYPANNHNCKSTSAGPRAPYYSKGHPERKIWLIQKAKDDSRIHRIVFLIQLGQSPTLEMIKSVKNIVLMLMRFLDESDEVGILNAEPDQLWSNFLCEQLVPVTSWTRYQILSYLNYIEHRFKSSVPSSNSIDLEDEQDSDSSYGIEKAIEMACANFSEAALFPPSAATIIHLTLGIDFNTMTQKQLQVTCPVFIETFFLKNVTQNEEELYKKTVQSAASKNIWRVQVFSLNQTDPESFAVKVAFKLNSKKEWWSLSDILSQFFPQEKENSTVFSDFSLPHWNPISKEAVIVAKRYVFQKGRPLGLVAIEIPVVHFTQHITYFTDENVCDAKNYAFLVDKNGRVIAHPALGRPDVSEEVLSPILIEQVEIYPGFLFLRRELLSPNKETGCHSLRLRSENSWVTYAWARVHDYIAVVVAFGESGGCVPDRESFFLRKSSLSPKSDVQHHLLLKKTHCCNAEAISTAKASLYFAPNAFSQPADAIDALVSLRFNPKRSLALMAFMSDNSGLLENQNKGVKLAVKNHVGALANIVPTWKARFLASKWNRYILTRFGTAAGGSFILLHPGSSVTPGYVPHSTVWFRKAVKGDGKLIFSPPAVDSQGIPSSTLSLLINVDINSENTSTKKMTPVAVLGATLNVGFFQTIIEGILPECRNKQPGKSGKAGKEMDDLSIRCFLLDDDGFVIYHPHLSRSLRQAPQIHVTQIEPLSVMDILQYGQNYKNVPMRKHTCHKLSEASATQGSLQRMYTLSMGPEGIQKLKHGELCSFYHILPVPDTNLFLGVVQDGCSSPAAFCPCSTVDRLCLNCLRIEPSDCECPCECPREPNFCAKQYMDLPADVDPCEFPPESLPMIARESVCDNQLDGDSSASNSNSSCDEIRIPCSRILRPEECIGSWDCDWCQANGSLPSCMTYRKCYDYGHGKGIRGRNSMDDMNEAELKSKMSPGGVGNNGDNSTQITMVPILGVLSVFLIFLGLVVYCYRHRALSSSSSQPDVHLLPLQESPMGSVIPQAGSSRSESDNEADNVPLHMVYLQRNPRRVEQAIPPAPRSPLGSVVGTDSDFDHGYSTMNNDDSECGAPLPLVYLDLEPSNHQLPHFTTAPRISQVETFSGNYNTTGASPTTHVAQVLVPVSVHEVSSK